MKIGDIAIGCNFTFHTFRNGMECEIIGELKDRVSRNLNSGEERVLHCYKVAWSDGSSTVQEPHFLRPKDEPGDWETLNDKMGRPIWRPEVIHE
jgi:hypothetical protein